MDNTGAEDANLLENLIDTSKQLLVDTKNLIKYAQGNTKYDFIIMMYFNVNIENPYSWILQGTQLT